MSGVDAEDLIARLSRGLSPADRASFRQRFYRDLKAYRLAACYAHDSGTKAEIAGGPRRAKNRR